MNIQPKPTLTFSKCLEMGLDVHVDTIAKVAEVAGKEFSIEQVHIQREREREGRGGEREGIMEEPELYICMIRTGVLKMSLAGANNSVSMTCLTPCIIIVHVYTCSGAEKTSTPAGILSRGEWRHSANPTPL